MVSWENTFQEIEQAKPTLAILPIGSIEQHGHHLPVCTDWVLAQELGRRVAAELGDCYLLPALPISCSREHSDFAGTLWVKPSTLGAMIQDIVGAVHHQGIEKVALLVCHGGNWIVKPTVRELNLDRTGVQVINADIEEAFYSGPGETFDFHAGRCETSFMLRLRPELVKADQMRPDYNVELGREFLDYTGMRGAAPDGHWGAPSEATVEIGERVLATATKSAVEYIRRTFAEIERRMPKQERD
jgi:creatinine amidohydrolase